MIMLGINQGVNLVNYILADLDYMSNLRFVNHDLEENIRTRMRLS